jgi:hypothetical protein
MFFPFDFLHSETPPLARLGTDFNFDTLAFRGFGIQNLNRRWEGETVVLVN